MVKIDVAFRTLGNLLEFIQKCSVTYISYYYRRETEGRYTSHDVTSSVESLKKPNTAGLQDLALLGLRT